MPQTDSKQPAAQRDGDRPTLQGDYYTGGTQPLQRPEGETDDRDTHEPGWTDGRKDGDGADPAAAPGASTTRSADVAKNR